MGKAVTSRRRLLQWASGAAVAPQTLLLAGAVPAQGAAAADPAPAGPGAVRASFGDATLRFEFDGRMQSRIARLVEGRPVLQTLWGAAEFIELADGRRIDHYPLQRHAREPIAGLHGKGERFLIAGQAAPGLAQGLEKTVDIRLYERYPGFAFVRVSYRNLGEAALRVQRWTNGAYSCRVRTTAAPEYWSYSGGTYPDRRDWVQPVKSGFAQDNFMGMSASDYGGGTPIVDIWRREGGIAVGHVDVNTQLVSLPVAAQRNAVHIALSARQDLALGPGERLDTLETFVAVHGGDYFATLDTYRRVMAERGVQAPAAPRVSYDPIWCAWGYERDCTTPMIEGTLAKARELGLEWAVIDDGWQSVIGDWGLDPKKYPRGADDMKQLVGRIKAAGLRPRLWFSPLSVAPGADLLHDHPDMLLLDKDGAVQNISWWNTFYLCPAYGKTVEQAQALVRTFIGDWGFAGLKIDGQHLNGVAPCFNPAHRHARPEESVERLHEFHRAIYETALQINPEAVIELCPCGTSQAFHNFPATNHVPASDPESSWQVRHKGKTIKALMGPSASYAGDHVELSDGGADFASTVGVGAVISTKFTWPVDPKPKDSFLLTPQKEDKWRKWIGLYREKMLPMGRYRGSLYDIGFDRPEAHVVEKDGRIYYAFYAKQWRGRIPLRGLGGGAYRLRDYFNDRDLGTVSGDAPALDLAFDDFLMIEAVPA
jgi:alpha-galactosidase